MRTAIALSGAVALNSVALTLLRTITRIVTLLSFQLQRVSDACKHGCISMPSMGGTICDS